MYDRARAADTGKVSHEYATLSLGEYIAMTIIPLICLAVWGIAVARADRYPEWRGSTPEQIAGPPPIGPGGAGPGRSVPGPLQVPVEPVSRTDDQPGRPERR